ncbi:MAG: hypothetical protein QMD11_11475 [Smithella sp.]|nr:hypothetical protein [Smithella sp.]
MMRLYVCLIFACLLFLPVCVYAQNPFMSSDPATSDAQSKPDDIVAEKQKAERLRLTSFAPVRFLSGHVTRIQITVRRDVERFMGGKGDSPLPVTVLLLAFFSFLYGMIHAAGPGHGKVFIGSYMIAGKSRFVDTVKAALTIVTAHTVSAVILIVVFMLIFGTVSLRSTAAAEGRLQLISATLICVVGLYLLVRGIWGALKKDAGFDVSPQGRKDKGLFALALSVGLIPCPGVILVMLFAINLGIIAVGIIAVLSMALGMIVTITLVGMLFLAAGKSALRAEQALGTRHRFISHGLTICGALLVLGFGLLLFAGY